MKKSFVYLFTIICIIAHSCVTDFKTGIYATKKEWYLNEFTFWGDSTFSYNDYGSMGKYSSGKYKIRDNKILLNSNIKDVTVPVGISILSSDSLVEKNRITFRFNLSEKEQKDYKCIPILNKDTLNNKEGIIYFTQGQIKEEWGTYTMYYTEPVDSVKLDIIRNPFVSRPREGLTTKTMYFDKILEKDITFNLTINDSLFGYRVFDDTMLEIKKNKIIFIDMEEDRMNTLYLRRD
jgi:hypothetical protein